jgi:hypothetical protein
VVKIVNFLHMFFLWHFKVILSFQVLLYD